MSTLKSIGFMPTDTSVIVLFLCMLSVKEWMMPKRFLMVFLVQIASHGVYSSEGTLKTIDYVIQNMYFIVILIPILLLGIL